MSRIPRQARRDQNEPEIVAALEAQGFSVARINGCGVPDLAVGKGKFLALVEIKQPKKGYTPAQVLWRSRWSGPAPITLRSVEDALKFALLAMEGGTVISRRAECPAHHGEQCCNAPDVCRAALEKADR